VFESARGFVFDLDGCVWNGNTLSPGVADTLGRLHRAGRGIAFLTNNSRATAAEILRRLHALGITLAEHALTPLEIIGTVIAQRFGRSRVLVIGAPEMAAVVAGAGHEVVGVERQQEATVLALGNDFDLSFERLAAACRVAARTGALVTPNVDARLPVENGDFLPGCGALVAAVAAAAGVAPIVVGKPEPPLFGIALERLRVRADQAVMVGDSVPSDMRGARRVGMRTALYAPDGVAASGEADVVIRSFDDLRRLAGV
jgi:HAD superfamily hydrolase (TIGR01450 family)